jgi:hypothetical protein
MQCKAMHCIALQAAPILQVQMQLRLCCDRQAIAVLHHSKAHMVYGCYRPVHNCYVPEGYEEPSSSLPLLVT